MSCIYKIFLPAYNSAKIIKKSIKIFQSYELMITKCSATFLWFTVYSSRGKARVLQGRLNKWALWVVAQGPANLRGPLRIKIILIRF